MLGTVGGGEHEYLAAFLDAVEQDQELGGGGGVVLGAFGGAGGSDGVYFVEENDGRGEFLSALEDVTDGGFGLADPLGEQGGTVDDLDVCAALTSDGAGEERLPRAWGTGEDDAVA